MPRTQEPSDQTLDELVNFAETLTTGRRSTDTGARPTDAEIAAAKPARRAERERRGFGQQKANVPPREGALPRYTIGKGERGSQKIRDPAAFQRENEQLADLFPVMETDAGTKLAVGAASSLAPLAKAPHLGFKALEHLGVSKETLARHFPNVKATADWLAQQGANLQRLAEGAEDPRFADQGTGSQLLRAAGSSAPFLASGGVAGGLAKNVLTGLLGGAQNAVTMYEDVLAETGDESKAMTGALVGLGIGSSEVIGVGGSLAKLDRATGGTVRKALAKMAVESVEEGAQELFQTISNGVAQGVLTDKEIDALKLLAEGGQAAGIGALFGGAVELGRTAVARGAGALPAGQPEHVPGSQGELTPEEAARLSVPMEEAGDLAPAVVHGRPETPVRLPYGPKGPPAAQTAGAEPPAPQAGPARPAEPTRTPEEVAKDILAGKEVPLTDLTPEALVKADEAARAPRPTITPSAKGPAPGAPQGTVAEPDQAPADSGKAEGVSPATVVEPYRPERRKLNLRPEDIAAEEQLKGIVEVSGDAVAAKKAGETHPLTGLLNKKGDRAHADRIVRVARRRPGTRAVRVRVDLTNFKAVNELFGHHVGDEVLKELGNAWGAIARQGDAKPSHIGGDEFAATLLVTSDADVDAIVARVEKAADETLARLGLDKIQGFEFGADAGWADIDVRDDPDAAFASADQVADERATARKVTKGRSKARLTPEEFKKLAPAAQAERAAKLAGGEQATAEAGALEMDEPEEEPKEKSEKSATSKADEEALEARLVQTARSTTRLGSGIGKSDAEVFDDLLESYKRMPRLKERTSTSRELQQFSTPMPLAFLAARLAQAESGRIVFEPTAGNGALVMLADFDKAILNELDPRRAEALRKLGFTRVTEKDATEFEVAPGTVDVVIQNPPFGRMTGGSWEVGEKFKWTTKDIDHAIALRTLPAMKADGRAVLIVGGVKPFGEQTEAVRTEEYGSMEMQRFYRTLYENYNVTDHFTVDGKLYDRQGAAWPVDIIVIEGRGSSSLTPPFTRAPRLLTSWDELRKLLPGTPLVPARLKPEGDGREGAGAPPQGGQAVAPGVREPAARPSVRDGDAPRGTEGGGGRARPDRGEGARGTEGSTPPGVAVAPDRGDVPGDAGSGRAGGPERVAPGRREPTGGGEGARGGEQPGKLAPADLPAEVTRGVEKVNEYQATYRPSSKRKAIGTVVPANMQVAADRALAEVRKEHGDVDTFVARELGMTAEQVDKAFAAEQVDAIALAIANAKRGDGFVIGDQTGVGKGRFVAAMLHWARQQGKVPVFITAKLGLYVDMAGRDIPSIGVPPLKPFITNRNLRGGQALPMPDGSRLSSLEPGEYATKLQEILSTGALPDGYDALFTTYDQLNPSGGTFGERNAAVMAIAPNALIVLDESHEAGGTEAGARGNEDATRGKWFRELMPVAWNVIYSSATFAKNPHVLTLYSRTGMGQAAESPEQLTELFKAGGVPLQQAVATQLTESGQYLRREKSFDGISMEMDTVETDRTSADTTTGFLREMFEIDLELIEIREKFGESLSTGGRGKRSGDVSVGEAGASSVAFSSVMHNLVTQMLLSMKARSGARRAVEALRGQMKDERGNRLPPHKPVLALTNTLEGLLTDYALETDSKRGDVLPNFNFGAALVRYLRRMRQVTRQTVEGTKERVEIPEDMIPADILARWNDILERIQSEPTLADLPASPIDAMIQEIEAAGFKVGEITGRKTRVRYTDEGAVLEGRNGGGAADKKTMRDFQDGRLDALILNESGATGVSLHASPQEGKDVRPRAMFVVQADPNIDTFMQMLGRINRTGQVVPPRYSILASDLPAEKRPAAVLMRKMASLNANTTASRDSAVSLKTTLDFFNQYGELAAAEVLAGDPIMAAQLGLGDDKKVAALSEKGALASNFTGRLPLLSIEEQERVYEALEAAYTSILAEAKERGENALEAEVHDLRAKVTKTVELTEGTGPGPFEAPSLLHTVDAVRRSRPLTWGAMQVRARRMLGLDDDAADLENASESFVMEQRARVDAALEAEKAKAKAAFDKTQNGEQTEASEAKRAAINSRWAKTRLLAESITNRFGLMQNRGVYVTMGEGDKQRTLRAWVVGIEAPKKGNVLAPSNWRLVLVYVDGENFARIPFSRMMGNDLKLVTDRGVGEAQFKAQPQETKETRHVVTGNILAGFSAMGGRGTIGFFTNDKGQLVQGIIVKRGEDPDALTAGNGVRLTPAQAIELVGRGGEIETTDGIFRVRKQGSRYIMTAKNKGGKPYYLSQAVRDITGDFTSARGKKDWEARVYASDEVAAVLAIYARDLDARFVAAKGWEKDARAITGERAVSEREALPTNLEPIMEDGEVDPDDVGGSGGVLASPLDVPPQMLGAPQPDPGEGTGVEPYVPIGNRLYGRLEREEKPGKRVSAPDIIDALSKVVAASGGDSPIRFGRLGRLKAAGVFKTEPEVIRVRTANDIATAAHEVAHALEKHVFGWVAGSPWKRPLIGPQLQRELADLGKALYGDRKPAGGYKREGWAEFFRYWVTERVTAEAKAPGFAAWFETEFLPAHPDLAREIENVTKLVERWTQQGSLERARASVVDPTSWGARWKKMRESGTLFAFKRAWTEMGESLHILSREMERKMGRLLAPSEDPFKLFSYARMTHTARVREMISRGMLDLWGNRVGPALVEIKPLISGRYQDFMLYLWARRAKALWNDPVKGPRNPGLSEADADQLLAELSSPRFELAAGKVYDWQEGLLNYAAQASPSYARVVAAIREADPGNYIPLQREFDALDSLWSKKRQARGLYSGAGIVSALKGSGRRIKDPLQAMIANAEKTVLSAHRRLVLDAVLKAAKIEGMGHLVEKVPRDQVPYSVTLEQALRAIKKRAPGALSEDVDGALATGDFVGETLTFFAPAQFPKGEDPVIPVWTQGEGVTWYRVDHRLASTLAGLDLARLPKVLDLLFGVPTRIFRAGTTGLRASFGLITNPTKDLGTLYANTRSGAWAPMLFMRYLSEVAKSVVTAATGGTYRSAYLDAYMRLGGGMALPLGPDSNETARAARELAQGRFMHLVDPRNWYEFFKDLIQFPETATRSVELREVARQVGWEPGRPMTPNQAIELLLSGAQVTADFRAAGALARVANQVSPFVTASIAGSRAVVRAGMRNPGRFAFRGLQIAASTLALWWAVKDEEWYKELKPELKFSYWHVPIWWNGRREIVMIPRPHEIGAIFAALPEMMADAWYRQDPESASTWFTQALKTLNPLSLPPIVAESAEQLANRDFYFDQPIVPTGELRRKPAKQYGEYTSRAAIFLGRTFDVSPRRIDHAIRGVFGGVGSDVVSVVGLGPPERTGREREAADLFVIGRLFKRGGEMGANPESVRKLYDELGELQSMKASDEEVNEQGRRRRLVLEDAAEAMSALSYVRTMTDDQDQRRKLTEEIIAIARAALAESEKEWADRSAARTALNKAKAKKKAIEQ